MATQHLPENTGLPQAWFAIKKSSAQSRQYQFTAGLRVDIEQHLSDLIILTNKKLKKGNVLSKKLLATAIACTALLTGCLIPESFKAKADFSANGDYTFSYDGTAVHAMAAAEEKKTGSLRAKDEEGLKAEATKMKNDSMVQSAEYLGHGRYQLKLLAKKKAGENLKMMDIFSVTHAKDGVITISSPKLSAKDVQELSKLGIKIDGTLEVILPKNVTVISHNATSEPKFFGLFGTYSWKIGSLDQRPEMKIKLN